MQTICTELVGGCGLVAVADDLDAADAVAAAHSIGSGTLSAGSLLRRYKRASLISAYQALSECVECDCGQHHGRDTRIAMTELVMRIGDLS
jgi:hypothetical protein